MKHICKTLDSMVFPVDLSQVACHVTRAGDILRLVTLIVQPFREASPPPGLDGNIQDVIIPKLCTKMEGVATLLEDNSRELDITQTSHFVFLLARLLQFVLTTTIVWSPQAKKDGSALSGVLVRLLMVCRYL